MPQREPTNRELLTAITGSITRIDKTLDQHTVAIGGLLTAITGINKTLKQHTKWMKNHGRIIDQTAKNVQRLDFKVTNLEVMVDRTDRRVISVESRLGFVEDGVKDLRSDMDRGFRRVDEQFVHVDKRFDGMDTRFDILDTQVTIAHDEHDTRITALEKRGTLQPTAA